MHEAGRHKKKVDMWHSHLKSLPLRAPFTCWPKTNNPKQNKWSLYYKILIYSHPSLSIQNTFQDPSGCLKPRIVPNPIYTMFSSIHMLSFPEVSNLWPMWA